ncbi:MAG: hypothetical protein NMK33_04585 [Candidatus Cardinium sp.]|uniref:hypothetical protein n=1 Tax=Cardinium endosymbiont of Dermatophagoides farinae TaxID=2597823 RepID=UPI001181DB97|nr:hypothetical protein [Cardinium endosymbiont of Dermatophagoides farinae]TSJ80708.1 hypothetical protein FPG78_01355 [Cardinium endosymbiont of Dermatophagoides farinae]UWW96704.1 MAG: hypothetical protein NMK33_04585 [Candidatus Cardinium sp.]
MPERNLTLGKISEEAKEDYLTLFQMLNDDDEKKQMEQTIKRIKNPDDLENCIQKIIPIHQKYNDIKELLTKREQEELQNQWKKYSDIKDIDNQIKHKKELIAQYERELKLIKDAPMLTRQHYIDLLKVLPEAESVKFKNDIAHADSLDKIDKLIASKLPEKFKQLDANDKESFSQLPDGKRQEMLRNSINQSSTTESSPTTPKEATAATQVLDIKKLIKDAVQDHQGQKDQDDDIPKDGWGKKLPLEGDQRNEFLKLILELDTKSQQDLKKLFDKTEQISIENLFSVFFEEFSRTERITLLITLIFIYRNNSTLAMIISNSPEKLQTPHKLWIWYNIEKSGINVLTKLKSVL